jgi:pentatricopeptide repeat protein
VRGVNHSHSLWTRPAVVRATTGLVGQQRAPSRCQSSRPLSFQKYYSSHLNLSNATDPQLVVMREKAQAIIERTPIGELDVDTWLEVEEQLHWWANRRTPQSVKISFLLLERIVAEQQTLTTEGYNNVSSLLNRNIVYALVLNWQQVIKKSAYDIGAVFTPQKLVHALDKLCDKSHSLEISRHALSLIIDATLHLGKQGISSLEAASFCEVLWERLVEKRGLSKYRPYMTSFNCVLSAWTTCARPDRALAFWQSVPQDIVTPDIRSYAILLSAFAKAGDGPAAELLLDHMCDKWQLQQVHARQGDRLSCGHDRSLDMVRPNVVAWNTVISAWEKSSAPDAASRAQTLLNRMYDPSNIPSVRPNLMTLNTVMACWSRSRQKDGPDRCLCLLQQIKDLYARGELESPPDTFSYTAAINAYIKAGRPSNAEDLFEELCRCFMSGDVAKPTVLILTSVLEAWALVGQVERAWAVLGRIRELHNLGVLPTGPDVGAYNSMIFCLFNYRNVFPDCAVKADALLQEMKKNPKTQPGIRSYTFTLQAWLSTPDGLDRAVELSRETLDLYSAGRKRRSSAEYFRIKAIILEFCRTGHVAHAQNIVFEVCELARENRSPPPEKDIFRSLKRGWSLSEDPEAALKAKDLDERKKQILGGSSKSRLKTSGQLGRNRKVKSL